MSDGVTPGLDSAKVCISVNRFSSGPDGRVGATLARLSVPRQTLTRGGEFVVEKRLVPKIGVAAGTVDNAGPGLGQCFNVGGLQVVGVNG